MTRTYRFVSSAVVCAALAAGCGTSGTRVSPSSATPGPGDLGPGGSTLKIAAPALVSPILGVEIQESLVLVVQNVFGTYASFPVTFEVEIRNPAGALVLNPKFASSGTPTTTSFPVTAQLEADTIYSWRARATFQEAFGPWSNTGTFKTQPAAYIQGNEVFDPLTNGKTAGEINGSHTFIPGMGLRLNTQHSFVQYVLPVNLQAGEFSLLATGYDEGTPGDKSKIMSMKEGFGDLTANDYRMSAEKRGRDYVLPGATTFRIITSGGEHNVWDSPRVVVDYSDENWYFWKFTWQTGTARLEVRRDSETGPIVYQSQIGTGTHPYRPVPHVVHIGAPVGRAGPIDATVQGMIAKNLWVSSRPRPKFPTFEALPSLLKKP